MTTRAAAPLAGGLGLLAAALAAGALLLGALDGAARGQWLVLTSQNLLVVVLVVTFGLVGALIASHRPANPIGWLCCVAALCEGLSVFGERYGPYALATAPGALPWGAEVHWQSQWSWAPGLGLILVFLPLLFPTGRPPSRRWRPVAWLGGAAIALLAVGIAAILWPARGPALLDPQATSTIKGPGWLDTLLSAAFPLTLLAGLAANLSLLVRFRRAHGDERQQLKWFGYAAAVTLAYVAGSNIAFALTGSTRLLAALDVLGALVIPAIPLAVGVAVLRYRLYEIDRIINRTLVYGALTATLAAVYFGGVALLQGLVRLLTGGAGQAPLAVVASTLAIAALFTPLRRRLQAFIDRRFYRRKYDAARTLTAFSARLRDETDLDQLTAHLLAVVEETMQPAHASLWLRPLEGRTSEAERTT